MCAVKHGDEVIVLEPAYDSYTPAIKLAGGVIKAVPLVIRHEAEQIHFEQPFHAIEVAITPRTHLLIINTPHNPTGTVWQHEDMLKLQSLLAGTDIFICSDEVYEHIVFDSRQHESIARYPELAARSFVISSFGKTFHVTGWKVGYVCAPEWLTIEFRKAHQYNVFTVNTPMQHGIAAYMQDANYHSLPVFYQKKRDYFLQGLARTSLQPLPCIGTYFQCVDYTKLPIAEAKLPELEFVQWLTKEIGVAAVPLSAFYSTPTENSIIRFCFAKQENTLNEALVRIAKI